MSNQFELSQIITRTGFSESEINAFVPVTITTLGENGSLIQGRVVKTSIHVAAVAVPAVVDPTGAGDSYRAGFIYGYTLGLDLATCGQMGSCAASFAIEHYGTQGHNFTKEEFLTRYQQAFKTELPI